ncbi:MAG: PQQ-dependent sugar dehydrogenase, partial [Chthoniobacterales bacterium]
DDRLVDLEMIFDPPADQASNTGLHFGCRIVFDGRGHVFFSIGDRGGPTNPDNLAQSLSSVTGKIHRLHDDGRVPGDNPFVGRKDAMPYIWALGVRNPQGLVYDTATDRLWETEHGPRGGDELNIIRKGANYGWPLATYGINYSGTTITKNKSLPGMEDPVVQWTPVIAASGLSLYRGDKFPRWRGNLFAGGLASEKLVRLELNGAAVTEQEIVLQDAGRIRDVREFDDGFLYLVYDEPGKVVRRVPAEEQGGSRGPIAIFRSAYRAGDGAIHLKLPSDDHLDLTFRHPWTSKSSPGSNSRSRSCSTTSTCP